MVTTKMVPKVTIKMVPMVATIMDLGELAVII
jgi:hypothetical protein